MTYTMNDDDQREGKGMNYEHHHSSEEWSHWKPALSYRGYIRPGERKSPPESRSALDSRIESEDGKETFFNRPIKWLK